MESRFIIAIIIVILVFILMYSAHTNNLLQEYICGMWIAENDIFCEISNIDSMIVYIGKGEQDWLSYKHEIFISINPYDFQESAHFTYCPSLFGSTVFTISSHMTYESTEITPPDIDMTFDIIKGTMEWYKDGQVYARLFKNHDATNFLSSSSLPQSD